MKIDIYFAKRKSAIDRALESRFKRLKGVPPVLARAMRYSVFSAGKRIRPVIVLETCRSFGGRPSDAMPFACAVELIHTYSLIHDDLPSMDDDDMRRGAPASHKRFGEAGAILAGDALLTLAFNVMAESKNSGAALEAVRVITGAAGAAGMVGGQAKDLSPGRKDAASLLETARLKTAKLFEASAALGALAAAAPAKKMKAAGRFGSHLGMAFQLTDDALDNEGYAVIRGADEAKEEAHRQIEAAKAALSACGAQTEILFAIADYVLGRRC